MISLVSPIKTPLHHWPAGVKFTALCAATVSLFHITDIAIHLVVFAAICLIYIGCGKVFFFAGVRNIRLLWPFVAIVLLWHYFSDDLLQGSVIVTRMLNALALANLVTMTTRLDDLMDFVRWCVTPLRYFGLKTRPVEIAVALVVRFTPVLHQKSCYIYDAWLARSPRKPRWRLIVPIAALALDDADHVAEALKARGGITRDTDKK